MQFEKVIVLIPGFTDNSKSAKGFTIAPDCKIKVPTEQVPVTLDFGGTIGSAVVFTDEANTVYADITIKPEFECIFSKLVSMQNRYPAAGVTYDLAHAHNPSEVTIQKIGMCDDNTDNRIMPITKGLLKDVTQVITGDHCHVECGYCDWHGSSEYLLGGGQIADTGDYADGICPRCGCTTDIHDYVPEVDVIVTPIVNDIITDCEAARHFLSRIKETGTDLMLPANKLAGYFSNGVGGYTAFDNRKGDLQVQDFHNIPTCEMWLNGDEL